MNSLKFATIILYVFLINSIAYGQKTEPEIRIEPITDNLFVLLGGNGLGAHVGVSIGEDGILLVDTMRSHSAEKLFEAIRTVSDKPIRFVINTHSHADHTGGNEFFSKQGATIIGHRNSIYSPVHSDMRVNDGFSMVFNSEEIRFRHVAAHTSNDLVVYFADSDLLFLGDTFTNVWHPTASTFGLASETAAMDLALGLCTEKTVIVPGHGFLDRCDSLSRSRSNTEDWYARMAQLVRKRKTPEDMMTDPELNRLRDLFVAKRLPPELPDARFRRFIDRTLSADFIATYPVMTSELTQFAGRFRSDNGEPIEIALHNDQLVARKKGAFVEQLVPLSSTMFHVRASLEGRYEFTIDRDGNVKRLMRTVGDLGISATRMNE